MYSFYMMVMFFTSTMLLNRAHGFCDDILNKYYSSGNNVVLSRISSLKTDCKDLFRLHNFDVTFGLQISCTKDCKNSIDALYNVARNIQNCECVNKECWVIKNRVNKCMTGRIPPKPISNISKEGCTIVYQKCHHKPKCRAAFDNMTRACNQMLNGIHCSPDCEKSLKVLLTIKAGRKFLGCECDGTQYYEGECLEIRDRILNKCKSKDFKSFLKNIKRSVTPL